MSAICNKVETSLVRWLASASSGESLDAFALCTHATLVAVHNTGLHVATGHESFTLNFYAGESESEVKLPSVVVVCDQGTEDDPGTGNFQCDVRIELSVPADSSVAIPSSVGFLVGASQWLHDMVLDDAIAESISKYSHGLMVYGVSERQNSRSVEGRRRIHTYQFSILCSGQDFDFVDEPEVVPEVEIEAPEIFLELPSTNYCSVAALGSDADPYLSLVAAAESGAFVYDALWLSLPSGNHAKVTALGTDDSPYIGLESPSTAATPVADVLKLQLPSTNYLFIRARGPDDSPYLRMTLT